LKPVPDAHVIGPRRSQRADPVIRWPSLPEFLRGGALATLVIIFAAVIGRVVATGRWYVALGLVLILPAVAIFRRYRLAILAIWLLVAPFVVETNDASVRKLFWLVHRGLPLAAVLVIGLGYLLGSHRRTSFRFGWPELMMGGYLVATALSIFYTSDAPLATGYLFYDRVLIPMCLYFLIRLVEPKEYELRLLVPVAAFILITQSVIGAVSWIAPHALPVAWQGLEGARTTGSLVHPNVFGTTLLFCGLLSLHGALSVPHGSGSRWGLLTLFLLALVMAFITFSRATWLAAGLVVLGLLFVYPRALSRLGRVAIPLIALAAVTGIASGALKTADDRFMSASSNESALSRLPVDVAAFRMFEAKPLIGWGYENFNRYDRQFQAVVGGYYPTKDHAAHNLYLTLLAEQGILGLLLFLGPALWWLVLTPSAMRNMPKRGFLRPQLLAILWLAFGSFFLVNQFSNFRVTFGLGMWWVVLGLIGSLVDRYRRTGPAREGRDLGLHMGRDPDHGTLSHRAAALMAEDWIHTGEALP
jgi:O-antigen ligase